MSMASYVVDYERGQYYPECGTWLTPEDYAAWKAGRARYLDSQEAINAAVRQRIGLNLSSACWWAWATGVDEWLPDTWWAE